MLVDTEKTKLCFYKSKRVSSDSSTAVLVLFLLLLCFDCFFYCCVRSIAVPSSVAVNGTSAAASTCSNSAKRANVTELVVENERFNYDQS